jgi:coproporphyrinogen III oxidase
MTTSIQKARLSQWFSDLQGRICASLETLEEEAAHLDLPAGRFCRESWRRQDQNLPGQDAGGGTMAIIKGRVFEKGGVNVSTVYGQFAPEFAKEIPGAADNPAFWASGISLVIHPLNPFVPAIHLNTRHIATTKFWFGGGTDLTPTFEFAEDTADFHKILQETCDSYDPTCYPRFKAWCDTYFYLPHRKEPRGIGGIFYDNLSSGNTEADFEKDFAFTRDVGEAFLAIYPALVRRHFKTPWTAEDKAKQMAKRGRYVEFNLLYDRGTHFGLKTHGNIDAIFMSLPPLVSWP